MKYLYLLMLLLFFSCGSGGGGSAGNSVYFIDPSAPVNGTGTEDSPYNTFSGLSLEPGAEYLIKRGTVLYGEITVSTSGNSTSDPVVIGAYGTGSAPVIDGSEIVDAINWYDEGGGIYSNTLVPSITEGRGNVTVDSVIQKFATATPGAGEYTIDSSGKIQIYDSPSGKIVRLSRRYFGIQGNAVSYVIIKDLHVRMASLHGIKFEDSRFITIENCTVEICGGAYIGSLQAGNGIEFGNSSSDCAVNNCVITEIFDSGISPQTYDNNSTASGFSFNGNSISKCGFAGVEIAVLSNGGKTGSSLSDVKVNNCIISSCGTGFSGIRYSTEGRGIKIAADAGAGSINNVSIDDTSVSQSEGEGIYVNGETGIVNISRTEISGNKRDGISVPDGASTSTGLRLTASVIRDNINEGLSYNAAAGKGLEVYNCTFYNNTAIDLSVYSNSGYLKLKNNIYNSTAAHLYSTYIIADTEIDYNCYYQNSSNVIGWGGTPYNSISGFHSVYTSFDAHSTGNDPLLDSSLVPGSTECRDKGVYISGVTTDINGRNFRTPPTIGAAEY